MKVIGLIGGMSWESTLVYYRLINETVREKLGGFHSARILLYSVDFHDIEALQRLEEWEKMAAVLEDPKVRMFFTIMPASSDISPYSLNPASRLNMNSGGMPLDAMADMWVIAKGRLFSMDFALFLAFCMG